MRALEVLLPASPMDGGLVVGMSRVTKAPAMKVFIFGATGYIGYAVTRAAVDRGWDVFGLVRSTASAELLREIGAKPVHGDLTRPETWSSIVQGCDAVVQLAAAFGGDLGAADAIWTDSIIRICQQRQTPLRVIYTGGCWLYPAREDPPLTEADQFDPLPAFNYMVEHRDRLHRAGVAPVTIHPGMVWGGCGGCTSDIEDAVERGVPVEIVGAVDVFWPLVHVDDLATLFILATVKAPPGTDYFGVSDPAISKKEIVTAVERSIGRTAETRLISVAEAVQQKGDWAAGHERPQKIDSDLARRILGWRPYRRFGFGQGERSSGVA